MLARDYAINLTRKLKSDNQIDNDRKTHVTNLETFWGQSVKWRHNMCSRDVIILQSTNPT